MNSPLRKVALACLVLFLLLLGNVNFVQVVKAGDYRNRPGNSRQLLDEYDRQRGPILVGGRPVAKSRPTDDRLKYLRTYSDPELYAAATGFYSFVYGATGVERAENGILAGTDDRLALRRFVDTITGKQRGGGSVSLSLDPRAQKAAYDGLRSQRLRGAVVAIEPSTGAILALAQSPSFDPETLSSHDPEAIRAAYEQLTKDRDNPLENRPLTRRYPPGSLFKVVTSAAALSSGRYTPKTKVDSPTVLDLPQTTKDLPNFGGESCGADRITLTEALRISCNTAFANVGLDLGGEALREQAERFGFNEDLDFFPLPTSSSVFPKDPDEPQTAQSAIGQFDVAATPLQMAMVAAAVANNGRLMEPYLVSEVRAPDLSVLDRTEPKEFSQAVTSEVAQQLNTMMVDVVKNGTGTPVAIPGVTVAGKTGTAQHAAGKPPHAWFMSFAPAENPRVAVAVVVEDGGNLGSDATGGRLAAPIAKAVIEAVLNR